MFFPSQLYDVENMFLKQLLVVDDIVFMFITMGDIMMSNKNLMKSKMHSNKIYFCDGFCGLMEQEKMMLGVFYTFITTRPKSYSNMLGTGGTP